MSGCHREILRGIAPQRNVVALDLQRGVSDLHDAGLLTLQLVSNLGVLLFQLGNLLLQLAACSGTLCQHYAFLNPSLDPSTIP